MSKYAIFEDKNTTENNTFMIKEILTGKIIHKRIGSSGAANRLISQMEHQAQLEEEQSLRMQSLLALDATDSTPVPALKDYKKLKKNHDRLVKRVEEIEGNLTDLVNGIAMSSGDADEISSAASTVGNSIYNNK